MGILRALENERLYPMPARFLVGRSSACVLRVTGKHASGEHATILWSGGNWEIRDLGSRNGTFVNGARLQAGAPVTLSPGAKIAFGDPDQVFEMIDDSAPSVVAVELDTGRLLSAQGALLVLPDETNPELSIYQDQTGAWILERSDGDLSAVHDEDVVHAAGRAYRLQLPGAAEGTPHMQVGFTLEEIEITFGVSSDEERIEMTITHRGMGHALEIREHNYVLLTLARARLEDAALPDAERGWREREQLMRMLKLDANALNVAIHRARQHLMNAGVDGAAGIVQVRRGQRRLGTGRFKIVHV